MCIIHDLQSICNQQQIIKCAVLIILYVIDMRKYSRFSIKCDPLKKYSTYSLVGKMKWKILLIWLTFSLGKITVLILYNIHTIYFLTQFEMNWNYILNFSGGFLCFVGFFFLNRFNSLICRIFWSSN